MRVSVIFMMTLNLIKTNHKNFVTHSLSLHLTSQLHTSKTSVRKVRTESICDLSKLIHTFQTSLYARSA